MEISLKTKGAATDEPALAGRGGLDHLLAGALCQGLETDEVGLQRAGKESMELGGSCSVLIVVASHSGVLYIKWGSLGYSRNFENTYSIADM